MADIIDAETMSEFFGRSDVPLDRRLFTLDADQYESFVGTLEEPPAPNEKLKALLASQSPWET